MTRKRDRAPEVEILLSTYNGGAHLKEQLDSLLAQTYGNWRLLVRDDGSSDGTMDILRGYSASYPDKVRSIEDRAGHLGPTKSFAKLMGASSANYLMFCDQDDVWLPEKIELTLGAMVDLEARHEGLPLLVHTDMSVSSSSLEVIAGSFIRFQHLNPEQKSLNNLLVLNNVTGCTMMINRELARKALPFPDEAIIHDWWITLVAAAFGAIHFIDIPTMLYRQHASNQVGAERYSLGYFARRIFNLGDSADLARRLVSQAKSFMSNYDNSLSKEDREVARTFSTIFEVPRYRRLKSLYKFDLTAYGFFRGLGISTLIVCMGDSRG